MPRFITVTVNDSIGKNARSKRMRINVDNIETYEESVRGTYISMASKSTITCQEVVEQIDAMIDALDTFDEAEADPFSGL